MDNFYVCKVATVNEDETVQELGKTMVCSPPMTPIDHVAAAAVMQFLNNLVGDASLHFDTADDVAEIGRVYYALIQRTDEQEVPIGPAHLIAVVSTEDEYKTMPVSQIDVGSRPFSDLN